jgi:peptidoglycan/LPS O-acetylase OafA/YrhL
MKDKIYFPGLNGIRFLAALWVIWGHVEVIKPWFGFAPISPPTRFRENLGDAVTVFFVLSGFLITYLLLAEIRTTGTIQVRKFYLRRILRIWPLYYLLVFLGFFGLPIIEHLFSFNGYYPLSDNNPLVYGIKLTEYLLFMPHLGAFLGSYITGIGHLWTIGIEENFYLMWPLLTKVFRKRILRLLLTIIGFKIFIILLSILIAPLPLVPEIIKQILGFINFFRIENMAVGGIGAYILFTNQQGILRIIFHPISEKIILALMICNILFFEGDFTLLSNQLSAVLYILFILNVSSNPRSTLKLENRVFNSLGNISFGLYMFHVLVIYLVMMAIKLLSPTPLDSTLFNILLYTVVTVLTISVAYLSYNYFEQPFLRLKQRFAIVKSGELPKIPQENVIPVVEVSTTGMV